MIGDNPKVFPDYGYALINRRSLFGYCQTFYEHGINMRGDWHCSFLSWEVAGEKKRLKSCVY